MARWFGERRAEAAAIPARTVPRRAPRTDEQVRAMLQALPRYRVLLHNDDVHEMGYVVRVLVQAVPPLSVAQALGIMLEAHRSGCAEVIICLKEVAEHYSECLRQHLLLSSIEPA